MLKLTMPSLTCDGSPTEDLRPATNATAVLGSPPKPSRQTPADASPGAPVPSVQTLASSLQALDPFLKGDGSIPEKLEQAIRLLSGIDRSSLPPALHADLECATDAMAKAIRGDRSGVAGQYLRLVKTDRAAAQSERLFFTIWNRLALEQPEPCILLCRVNRRNLDLLDVTRSRRFVEALVGRLGAESYPEAVLASRMQGIEIVAGAGFRPHVLFADFVSMPPDSGVNPATAGGLLFDSFADSFLLDQMPLVEAAFPNVAAWLNSKSLLNQQTVRVLTTAHVQGHDLCGHSVPYDLRNPTRLQADPYIRTPLEELYADVHAMWMFGASATRSLLTGVLSETELDAIPILVAMKRLTFYAQKNADDLDARCSWTMWGYWRKSGLIRRVRGKEMQFSFDLGSFHAVVDQMLSDILHVEREIAAGASAYERACRNFNDRFGCENPLTKRWEMPDELAIALSSRSSTTSFAQIMDM